MANITVGDIRYNAQIGAFEARVDIERTAGTFRYPCEFAAPLDASIDHIRRALAQQAMRMSDSTSPLRSSIVS